MTIMNFDIGFIGFAIMAFAVATLAYAGASTLIQVIRSALRTRTGATLRPGASAQPRPAPTALSVPESATATFAASRQIERLAGFVGSQSERADVTQRLHNQAGQQLDLASYAIQTLVQDLQAIVPSLAPAASPHPSHGTGASRASDFSLAA